MEYVEVNFDGLIGPTHNYAGLSFGNVASMASKESISYPKDAALQGLEKMRTLYDLGIPQAILPAHPRPNINLLNSLGYKGTISEILNAAFNTKPEHLMAAFSASSMWTANAATISPSVNTTDAKVHITPANLATNLHREQEADYSYKILQQIFLNQKTNNYFILHPPLNTQFSLNDEGAANHSFLCSDYNKEGLELFVYGKQEKLGSNIDDTQISSQKLNFPARQNLAASMAIANSHNIKPDNKIFLQQSAAVINAGAFHNDVVCVGNKNVLLYHEYAFDNAQVLEKAIKDKFADNFYLIKISNQDLDIKEAVKTYLFNSQIVSKDKKHMILVAPIEVSNSPIATKVVDSIIASDNPIQEVKYVDCRQSMKNGGGPACLRLRVIMPQQMLHNLGGNIVFNLELYNKLKVWVNKHYREQLSIKDLLDLNFIDECKQTFAELEQILQLKLL